MNPEIFKGDIQNNLLFEKKQLRPFKTIQLNTLSIEELKYYLKKNTDNVPLLKYLGIAYSKSGKNQKAKEIYRKILRLNPKAWKVQRKLGDTYYHLKQYRQAVKAYKKTLVLQPDDMPTHTNLGTAFFLINDVQNAIIHLEKVLKNKPNHIISLNNLGILYLQIEQAKKSIPLLERANRIDPSHFIRQLKLGSAYEKAGEYIKAELLYLKILKKLPNFVEAYNSLAEFYLKQLHQPETAKIYFKKSLSIAPNQPHGQEIRNIIKKLEQDTKPDTPF